MTTKTSSSSLKPYIEILIAGERHLTIDETEDAFIQILNGADEVQVGSLLCLLRARQETANEITGIVRAMNKACNKVELTTTTTSNNSNDNNNNPPMKLLDIVGTGGDGADTINISTASVVLAASCGCIVAKGGNRSVSSRCGSADVLEMLGVQVDLLPSQIIDCVQQINIAFMFAPINHPAMKYVAPTRKKLGIRTCFNIVGPLVNAAGAQHIVLGVFHENLMSLMSAVLQQIGRIHHAVIIHGCGLDEISPLGPSKIIEIKKKNINSNNATTSSSSSNEEKDYEVKQYEFDPLDVGIERCTLEELKGGDPEQNAQEFRNVLQGGLYMNAKRNSIILNAGFGNYVYGITDTIKDGIQLAKDTLQSGKAATLLDDWIRVSQEIASTTK